MNLSGSGERLAGEARHQEFGKHLRHLRESAGLSRGEMVRELRRAGLNPSASAYAKWEDGTNRPREYDVAAALADTLHLAPFSDDRALLFWLAGEWTERIEAGQGLPGSRCRRLVGRTELIDDVVGCLRTPGGPRLILLAALGGFGKTELARYVAERMLDGKEFADAAWLDLRTREFDFTRRAVREVQSTLDPSSVAGLVRWLALRLGCHTTAELTARLRAQPILVVVDNLETFPEEDRELAVSRLHDLIGNGPSRAIITSRFDVAPPYIHRPRVGGLTPAATRELLDLEAGATPRLAALRRLSDDDVATIWKVTRGMPFALHLLIGQCQHFDPARVVESLRQTRGEDPSDESLFGFLYRQAWEELGPAARALLIYLATATRSGQAEEQLLGLSPAGLPLEPPTLSAALVELLRWFLIERAESGEAAGGYSYTLHPLTRAFVLSRDFRPVWEKDYAEETVRLAAVQKHQEIFEATLGPASAEKRADESASDVLARAIPDCLESMRYYLAGGDAERVLWYWRWLSSYLWMYGRHHEYVECDQYALVAAKRVAASNAREGRLLEAVISAELAFSLLEFNELTIADHHAARAEEIFRSLGHPFDVATALRYRATIANCQDDLERAERLCREALRVLDTPNDTGLGESAIAKAAATTRLDTVIHAVAEGQRKSALSTLHNLLGDIQRKRGDYRAARREFVSALALTLAFRGEARAYRALAPLRNLGYLYEVNGAFPKAKAYYRRCLNLTADGTRPDFRAGVLTRLAQVAVHEGNTHQARNFASEALASLQVVAYSALKVEALRILGTVVSAGGYLCPHADISDMGCT